MVEEVEADKETERDFGNGAAEWRQYHSNTLHCLTWFHFSNSSWSYIFQNVTPVLFGSVVLFFFLFICSSAVSLVTCLFPVLWPFEAYWPWSVSECSECVCDNVLCFSTTAQWGMWTCREERLCMMLVNIKSLYSELALQFAISQLTFWFPSFSLSCSSCFTSSSFWFLLHPPTSNDEVECVMFERLNRILWGRCGRNQ